MASPNGLEMFPPGPLWTCVTVAIGGIAVIEGRCAGERVPGIVVATPLEFRVGASVARRMVGTGTSDGGLMATWVGREACKVGEDTLVCVTVCIIVCVSVGGIAVGIGVTVSGIGVGVTLGNSVAVSVRVTEGVGVSVWLWVGDAVYVSVGTAEGMRVGVWVGNEVWVFVTVKVGVSVAVWLGVSVRVVVAVKVGVWLAVSLGVAVGGGVDDDSRVAVSDGSAGTSLGVTVSVTGMTVGVTTMPGNSAVQASIAPIRAIVHTHTGIRDSR